MAILKKAWLRAGATVLTLMLGIGLFVNAVEGKNARVTEVTQPSEVPYYYTGPETSNIAILQDLDNWSTDQEPNHACGRISEVPCFIMADSEAGLDSKLQACTDLDEVLAESPSRRENQ